MLWILDVLDGLKEFCVEHDYKEVTKKLEEARIACFSELQSIGEQKRQSIKRIEGR